MCFGNFFKFAEIKGKYFKNIIYCQLTETITMKNMMLLKFLQVIIRQGQDQKESITTLNIPSKVKGWKGGKKNDEHQQRLRRCRQGQKSKSMNMMEQPHTIK